jgi:polysaccharide biosynthesis protein PslH
MRVLVLSPFYPFHEDNGSKMRIMTLLRSLEGHDVRLVAFRDEGDETDEIDPGTLCRDIILFDRPKISGWRVLKNHMSLRPLLAERFFMKKAADKIRSTVEEGRIDIVIAETLLMSRYLPHAGRAFRILDEHNLEFVRAERRAKTVRHPLKKLYQDGIRRRMQRYELNILSGCHMAWVCSEEDRAALQSLGVRTRLKVVPNAVDTEVFRPAGRDRDFRKIVFLGTLWYEPNADAVEFFAAEILPGVRNRFPDVTFVAVGDPRKNPRDGKIRNVDVVFTGYVPDVRPHIGDAAVFAVPLRMGSGTRLKILTAMAMGLPVVSTSIGAEGLDVADGENILIADTAEDFRDRIIALLENPGLGMAVGNQGRHLAEARYSRTAVQRDLSDFWKTLAAEIGSGDSAGGMRWN